MEYDNITKHHLIPKTYHSNKKICKLFTVEQMNTTIDLCLECHKQIHTFIKEKDMAKTYNTLDNLLKYDIVHNYIEWKKKHQYRGK